MPLRRRTTAPLRRLCRRAVKQHVCTSRTAAAVGRPLVLIHGWPLSAQAWKPQVSALREAGYRVEAYDRRGFGRSDKPASGYGYEAWAEDLQRVMGPIHCQLSGSTPKDGLWPMPGTPSDEFETTLLTFKT